MDGKGMLKIFLIICKGNFVCDMWIWLRNLMFILEFDDGMY